MKKNIALLFCTVLGVAVFAQNESDFKTFTVDRGVFINGYEGWDTEIVIPARIGGSLVVGVSGLRNMGLTRVSIPDGVSIRENAFSDNPLASVTIGNGVTVDSWAFSNNRLANLVLGADVSFMINAFSGSVYYEYLYNGKKAGNYSVALAFTPKRDGDFEYIETRYGTVITGYHGTNVNQLVIPGQLGGSAVIGIGAYHEEDGQANNESGAFSSLRISRMQLPEGITFIIGYAFASNQLTSVTIPSSVISIGERAFYDNWLTSITIPGSVTSISEYAFSRNRLTSVTIPSSVTSIGGGAFYDNRLTSITIPSSVTYIGGGAFSANQLTSVTIPSSVTYIGGAAFSNNQLTSVTIPSSVTYIDQLAFSENPLTRITFERGGVTIPHDLFLRRSNLATVYASGGAGTYTRPDTNSDTWTKVR
jgi:hypothetical protein